MKVKIIKVEVPPADEWGRADPLLMVKLPGGEEIQVQLYYHSERTLGATRARKRVLLEIALAIKAQQNRTALLNAAKALDAEFDVDLTEDAEDE